MDPKRAARVERLFHRAVRLEGEARERFLEAQCGGDRELLEEVRKLLAADAECRHFLDFLAGTEARAESAAEFLIGRQVGSFRVTRLIAGGGMGIVFEAEQEFPKRTVALKILRNSLQTESILRRFRNEAQILARLHHPGIAQVYEAGMHRIGGEPLPYIAMEYIPGAKTIREYARHRGLSVPERVKLFVKVCRAVEHGHRAGIVHRDLKPGNILVDLEGQPKVIDFGIARPLTSDPDLQSLHTREGVLLGTVEYMSPEQCDAKPGRVDQRSDIYSLGVVLYELVSGERPYDADSSSIWRAAEVIRSAPPRRLRGRGIGTELEAILLKALEKDPDRRYQTAGDFAEDLIRYLNREPVLARPPTALYQLQSFCRRHKALTASVAAVGAVLVFAAAVSFGFAVEARRQRNQAQLESYRATCQAILATTDRNDPSTALRFAGSVRPEPDYWEWRYLKTRLDHSVWTLNGEFRRVTAVFPEKRRAVLLRSRPTGTAEIHELELSERGVVSARCEELEPTGGIRVEAAALSGDGRKAALVMIDPSEVDVYERQSNGAWSKRRKLKLSAAPSVAAAFDPSGRYLAVGIYYGSVALFDLAADAPSPWYLSGHSPYIYNLEFSLDGTRLASASEDFTACIWDVSGLGEGRKPQISAVLVGHSYKVMAVAFRPDGKELATGSLDGTIRIWDVEKSERDYEERGSLATGRCIKTLLGHAGGISAVAYAPLGDRLASGASDRTIRIWEVDDRFPGRRWHDLPPREPAVRRCMELGVLRGHEGPVHYVFWRPDSEWIVSAGRWSEIKVWPGAPVEDVWILHGNRTSSTDVIFDPRGTALYSGSRRVRVWDPDSATAAACISNDEASYRLAVSKSRQNRHLLAGGSALGWVTFWDVEDPHSPKLKSRIEVGDPVTALALDGARLAVGATRRQPVEGRVYAYRDTTGDWSRAREECRFDFNASRVSSVVLFGEGRFLAVGFYRFGTAQDLSKSPHGGVHVYDLKSKRLIYDYEDPSGGAHSLAALEGGAGFLEHLLSLM